MEYIYPDAQNSHSKRVASVMPKIIPAISRGLDTQEFISSSIIACNALDTSKGSEESAVNSVYNAARVGLYLGGVLGHAFITPRKGRFVLIVGYKGYLELAFSNGFLSDCHAEVILKGERFERFNNSSGPQLMHEIPIERCLDRSSVAGAYCIYHTRAGGHGLAVVSRQELNRVDTQANVWASDYIPMAKKTAIRAAAKWWQVTQNLAMAMRLDDQADADEPQSVGDGLKLDQGDEAFSLKSLKPE